MGIIGGADGPTAIFVAAAPDGWIMLGGLVLAVIALPIILIRRRKRKQKAMEE